MHRDEREPLETLAAPSSRVPHTLVTVLTLVRFILLLLRNKKNEAAAERRADAAEIERVKTEGARETCDFISRVGGVWVKVGQLVAGRRDLLPAHYCDALEKLHDRVPGFEPQLAVEMIEASLGGPLEAFFDEFSTTPLAAATIGQVHVATLRREKCRVIVKVKRPQIAEAFARDVALVKFIGTWSVRLGYLRTLRWSDLIFELENMIVDELDYRIEAASGRLMRKSLKPHDIYAPKVFKKYCTRDVLVTEFIPGVLMSEFLRLRLQDKARAERWCEDNGIKPKVVGRRLYESFHRQLHEDNLFHADLHPGNIMLLRNNRLALIDFGAIGINDRTALRRSQAVQNAAADYDFTRAMDILVNSLGYLPPMDSSELIHTLAMSVRGGALRLSADTIPFRERMGSEASKLILPLLAKFSIPATWDMIKYNRSMDALMGTIQELLPSSNINKLLAGANRSTAKRARRRNKQSIETRLTSLLDGAKTMFDVFKQLQQHFTYVSDILRVNSKQVQTRGRHAAIAALEFASFGVKGLALAGVAFLLVQVNHSLQASNVGSGFLATTLNAAIAHAEAYQGYLLSVLFFLVVWISYRKLKKLSQIYNV